MVKNKNSFIGNLIFKARYTKYGQKTFINIILLIALCIISGTINPVFYTWRNLFNIAEQIGSVVIILAPFTLLMVCGNIDLSVGSTVALAGVSAALFSKVMPLPMAFLMGVLIGVAVGVVNAVMVVYMGINSFIATIGTMYIARGIALLISQGTQVSSVAPGFSRLGNTIIGGAGGVSIFVPIWIVFVIVFTVMQRKTTLGRYAVSTGSDEEAAFLSGVPVARTRVICFVLTGFAAGVAGILYASQLGSGSPTSADGLEFRIIVAAVVGGCSLDGGEGSVRGTLLGAVIVGVLMNLLNLARVSTYWQRVALGLVLVVMIALDVFVFKKHIFTNNKAKKGK